MKHRILAACLIVVLSNVLMAQTTINGVPVIGGPVTASQMPALTGDCTTSAGAVATTCTAINGKAVTLANSLTTSGNFALTLTQTATTNVTLPTSGTLATTAGNVATATALASAPTKCSAGNYTLGIDVNGNAQNCTAAGTGTVTSVTGTTNQISVATGTTTPALTIPSAFAFPGTWKNNVVTNASATGNMTLDLTAANSFKWTLTGNVTGETVTHSSGALATLLICQGGTAKTLAWDSTIKTGGYTIGSTINTCSTFLGWDDGTNLYLMGLPNVNL